jgi:hypothetical protein
LTISKNAVEAMPNGGTINVKVKKTRRRDRFRVDGKL